MYHTMPNRLFLLLGGLAFLFYLWIGVRASRRLDKDHDYFLMGRSLTFVPLCFTLLATQLGGGTLLGAAEEAYHKGAVVFLYPLGQSLGMMFLGLGFGGRLQQMGVQTIPEIFEKMYNSRRMRLVAAGVSVVALYLILVAVGVAMKKFFVSVGLKSPLYLMLFWGVFVAYTVMGGLKAVVDTDLWQAIFVLVGLVVTLLFVDRNAMAWDHVVVARQWSLRGVPWGGWLLMPFCFMLIEQDMGQRCFAAKTPRTVALASVVAGVLLMVGSGIAILLGIWARAQGIQAETEGSVLLAAVKAFTPPALNMFFVAVMVMAIASTADSLLCSIGTNIALDLFPLKTMSKAKQLRVARLITLLTGLSALGLVYCFGQVVALMVLAYELAVSLLFVPVLMAVWHKRPCPRGAMVAMFAGGVGFVVFRIRPVAFPKEILTLLLAAGGYAVGHFSTCLPRKGVDSQSK